MLFFDPNSDNGWLANFSDHKIILDEYEWASVEHYFQASKFFNLNNCVFNEIRLSSSPREAKEIARINKANRREDWSLVKEDIMYKAIFAKFTQHPELRDLLISTGASEIIEDSKSDYYWGIGDGSGRNRMGKLIKKLRDYFNGNDSLVNPRGDL